MFFIGSSRCPYLFPPFRCHGFKIFQGIRMRGPGRGFSSIISLLFRRFPAEVSRFIVPIIVYPAQCKTLWSIPHIIIKFLKIIYPFLTHGDTPTTVRRVFRIVFSVASPFCASPRIVGRRSRHSMRKAVLISHFGTGHTLSFLSRCKVRLQRRALSTTLTKTPPRFAAVFFPIQAQYSKFAEFLPSKVFLNCHDSRSHLQRVSVKGVYYCN